MAFLACLGFSLKSRNQIFMVDMTVPFSTFWYQLGFFTSEYFLGSVLILTKRSDFCKILSNQFLWYKKLFKQKFFDLIAFIVTIQQLSRCYKVWLWGCISKLKSRQMENNKVVQKCGPWFSKNSNFHALLPALTFKRAKIRIILKFCPHFGRPHRSASDSILSIKGFF